MLPLEEPQSTSRDQLAGMIAYAFRQEQALQRNSTDRFRLPTMNAEFFRRHPELLDPLVQYTSPLVDSVNGFLAGLELGATPLSRRVAKATNLPHLTLRQLSTPNALHLYTPKKARLKGQPLVIIEGTIQNGGQLYSVIKDLRGRSLPAQKVIAAVLHDRSDASIITNLGVPVTALYTYSEILSSR